ncbi:MAG: penicillin acylase family protein, partial [Gammaproteobacteria bacterium]|nr:penicillin acylase family protein [Gammaproteobacteria bacterium]
MKQWLRRILITSLVLLLLAFGSIWWLLRGSLPRLDGDVALAGLSAPVTVARDALGVATIDAANETDAMRAAGELSGLFGARALDADRKYRVHRMRARVDADLAAIAGARRPQLQAYADGVNAGRDALRVRPWPYLLLGQPPQPWTAADSALTGIAMYFDLHDAENARELALWRLRPHLPSALFALLTRDGTRWDAPLIGKTRGDATLPDVATVDLRMLPMPKLPSASQPPTDVTPGSNNFAVSGALTGDGRAILADDMHLSLRAPNIWFRARLRYADARAPGGRVDITGFTLPGLPAVVVGSNTHVAWGFTNSYIDALDWKRVRPCTGNTRSDACDAVTTHTETIAVAGGDPVTLAVENSAWGPIVHKQTDGTALVLRWIAHLPGALNFGLADFARARDLDDALAIADRTALPTQNFAIADRNGGIAWRLLGPIALRDPGCSGGAFVIDDARDDARPAAVPLTATATHSDSERTPAPKSSFLPFDRLRTGRATREQESSVLLLGRSKSLDPRSAHSEPVEGRGNDKQKHSTSDSKPATTKVAALTRCTPWPISTASSPLLTSPTIDRLWTANARVIGGDALTRIGDGGYAFGGRARQIRDGLFAKQQFTERDLLAIQLDDRAVFMTQWWQLLRRVAAEADTPALRALADAAKNWQGRASTDAVSYRITRAWRLSVHARIRDGLTAPAQAALGDDFAMPDFPQLEGVVWPLLQQRPVHLMPRRFASASQPAVAAARCSDANGWL